MVWGLDRLTFGPEARREVENVLFDRCSAPATQKRRAGQTFNAGLAARAPIPFPVPGPSRLPRPSPELCPRPRAALLSSTAPAALAPQRGRRAVTALLSFLAPAVFAPALAQTTFTDPLDTATSGDITLESGDSIELNDGTAITINSNNILVNNGLISIDGDNAVVGVRAEGGNTGAITNAGSILLLNIADPETNGADKTGVLVSGSGAFTGAITFDGGSLIDVEGERSVGLAVETPLVGDITHSGRIDLNGADSVGILVEAPVTGAVFIDQGVIDVWGPNARGVQIDGPVSGALTNSGTIDVTGIDQNFQDDPNSTEDDDLTVARSIVEIGASLGEGFVNAGPGSDGEVGVQPGSAVLDGQLVEFGILVSPKDGNLGDGTSGNVVLSEAGTEGSAYGLINRGVLSLDGIDDGDRATGIRLEGATIADSAVTTTVEGGVLNTGTVAVTTLNAPATGLSIGPGASAQTLVNEGGLTAAVSGTIGGQASAVIIEEGGSLTRLENSGAIGADSSGTDAASILIEDRSGTLTQIDNTGSLGVSLTDTATVLAPEDAPRIALSLANTTADITVTNGGTITGDILLGAGDDVVEIVAAPDDSSFTPFIAGAIDTGDGADRVVVNGGGLLTGSLTQSGGTLDLEVMDGTFLVGQSDTVSATNLTVGENGILTVQVSSENADTPRLNVAETVDIQDSATVQVELTDFLGESADITVIDAGTLILDNGVTLDTESLSLLYTGTIGVSEADTSDLVLTLDLKSPEELELTGVRAEAFPSLAEALEADSALSTALGGLETNEELASAIDQLLPDTGLRTRAIAITLSDQTTAVIHTRLDAMRAVNVDNRTSAWFQVFGSVYDQEAVGDDLGFEGETYSVAGGFDGAWLGANALGASFIWSGSRVQELDSFDEEFIADTLQLGLYGSWSFGGAFFDVQSFYGYNTYRSTRRVEFDSYATVVDGEWDGTQISANARIGYDYVFGKNTLSPYAGFDWLELHENALTETSASPGAALSIEERTIQSMRANVGLEYSRVFERRRGGQLIPNARIGYRYEFENDPVVSRARFAAGDSVFSVSSGELEQTGLTGGAGVAFDANTVVVELGYDILLEETFTRHSGGVNFRFLFGR